MGVNSGCGFVFGSIYHLFTPDIIERCDSYFITKCDKNLLQNASEFLVHSAIALLQNLIVITKCDVYYKMRRYNNSKIYLAMNCSNLADEAKKYLLS